MNLRRTAAIAALTLAGLAIGTGIAAAHVRVSADTTVPGAYSVLTFKVPTESATASTTGITITLPTATPLESVSFQQLPGWTVKVVTERLPTPVKVGETTITEAITSVSYTAQQGGGIPPGGFGFFALSVGPLPQTAALAFPVDQHYSDGTVVKWADAQAAGAAEPEHPVPTLTLGAASDSGMDNHGATVTSDASDAAALVAANTDTTARVTAIAALVIAAFSVLMGAIALRRPAAVAAATALAAESAEPQPKSSPTAPSAARTGTQPKKRNR
ncbi:MAG: YcnI family protein [Nakamurella sp.]